MCKARTIPFSLCHCSASLSKALLWDEAGVLRTAKLSGSDCFVLPFESLLWVFSASRGHTLTDHPDTALPISPFLPCSEPSASLGLLSQRNSLPSSRRSPKHFQLFHRPTLLDCSKSQYPCGVPCLSACSFSNATSVEVQRTSNSIRLVAPFYVAVHAA